MKIALAGCLAFALIPAAGFAAPAEPAGLKLEAVSPAPGGDLDALLKNLIIVSDNLYAIADVLAADRAADVAGPLAAQLEAAEDHIRKADAALARKDLPRNRKKVMFSFARIALHDEDSEDAERLEAIHAKAAILRAQYSLLNLRTAAKPSKDEAEWASRLAALKTPPAPRRVKKERNSGVAALRHAAAQPPDDDAEAAAPPLPPVDEKIAAAADAMGSTARRLAELSAKSRLGSLRAAISIRYADTDGVYPASLDALVPKYVPEIPRLELPGHAATNKVVIIEGAKGGSVAPYVRDTGGWLYFASPRNSKLDGAIAIDCAHQDVKGSPLAGF